jgi:hypothetical protein
MDLHSEAPESRTCSGCSHYGVNLQMRRPPTSWGFPPESHFSTESSIRFSTEFILSLSKGSEVTLRQAQDGAQSALTLQPVEDFYLGVLGALLLFHIHQSFGYLLDGYPLFAVEVRLTHGQPTRNVPHAPTLDKFHLQDIVQNPL